VKSNRIKKELCFLIVMLVAVLALAGCSGEQKATEPSYEMLGTEPATLPPVQISMPEYELTYSGELTDVIVVKEVTEFSGLEFTVKLSQTEAHIFTLHYNTVEGDFVTVLDDAKGNKVPVAFLMATIPEGLSDADAQTFYRAQEAVNEIAESLIIK